MKKVLLVVVIAVSVGLLSGCAAGIRWNAPFYESVSVDDAKKIMQESGAKEIGSYTVLFNGWYFGYENYQSQVSAEMHKGGRFYHVVVNDYIFWSKVVGYVREVN